MTDIASLSLEVKSDQVKQANIVLRDMAPAASAAERAVKAWGMSTDAASKVGDDFSKRVQGTIRSLEFERAQLTRTAAEQERFTALRRAGVAASSAEGIAISAAVASLQKQRDAHSAGAVAASAAGSVYGAVASQLRGLAIAYVGVAAAHKIWDIALKTGDLGEQAEQIGINSDQLQAYRLAGAQAGIASEEMDKAVTRLARTMGSAKEGNQQAIELFQRLKVNLLDANGELRPTADILPEVARGLNGVTSSSQKTADLMALFSRGGAKMTTVLQDLANGSDTLVNKAREQNAIVSPEAIAAWDRLGDHLKLVEQKWKTLIGEFGAQFALPGIEHLIGMLEGTKKELEAIQKLWQWIVSNLDTAKKASIQSGTTPFTNDTQNIKDRLEVERQRLQFNPNNTMAQSSVRALEQQLAAREDMQQRMQTLANQSVFQTDEDIARRGKLPISAPPLGVTTTGTVGVGNPVPKGAAEGYQRLTEEAKKYIAVKNAETAGIGLSADAAARLKHEQELLGKAAEGNLKIGPAQTAQLKSLAAAMADADAAFAKAKFLDDMKKGTEAFVADQELERAALFQSAEAADQARFAQELLTKAKQDGLVVDAALIATINAEASARANAKSQTDTMREAVQFAKTTTSGFILEINQGLREGKDVVQTFGDAFLNMLNKISDKLLEMAVNDIFNAAFGGKNAGAGQLAGLFGGLFGAGAGVSNGFGGLFGGASFGGTTFADALAGGLIPVAKGGVFSRGNIIPFASGGIVSRPTLFGMANGGIGMMGEAGDEAVMPLRRGPGGRLGVEAHSSRTNSGQQQEPVVVSMTNYFGSDVSRAEFDARLTLVREQAKQGAIAGIIEAKSSGGSIRRQLKR